MSSSEAAALLQLCCSSVAVSYTYVGRDKPFVFRVCFSSLFSEHEKANVARANSAQSNVLAYALYYT
jgi:hypothetical protein